VTRALDAGIHWRTNCRLILVEQAFEIERRPCGKRAPLPDRVTLQTLAAGRAYEWAASRFPPALAYIRARLDDVSWSLPSPEHRHAYTGNWIAFNNLYLYGQTPGVSDRYGQTPGVSDRFAVVPAHLGSTYFEAWRVWSENVNCNHNCFASSSIEPSKRRTTHPRGECAISAWLLTAAVGVQRLLAKNTAHALVRQVNQTHLFITTGGTMSVPLHELPRRGSRLLTYADAARIHSEFLKVPCDITRFTPPVEPGAVNASTHGKHGERSAVGTSQPQRCGAASHSNEPFASEGARVGCQPRKRPGSPGGGWWGWVGAVGDRLGIGRGRMGRRGKSEHKSR
jgi:hypothetical protein